jgi:hypothetical protein
MESLRITVSQLAVIFFLLIKERCWIGLSGHLSVSRFVLSTMHSQHLKSSEWGHGMNSHFDNEWGHGMNSHIHTSLSCVTVWPLNEGLWLVTLSGLWLVALWYRILCPHIGRIFLLVNEVKPITNWHVASSSKLFCVVKCSRPAV